MPSEDLSDLVNLGIVASTPLESGIIGLDFKGILICGLPRSGTTAFARALEQLGFSLGPAGLSPVAELASLHPPLRAAMHGGEQERINLMDAMEAEVDLLSRDNQHYIIKLPDSYRFLDQEFLPRGIDLVIFVTRDPLCVAVRNSKSVGIDMAVAIKKAVSEYASFMNVVASCSYPNLLVPYEKLLAMPVDFLSAIAKSLGFPEGGENVDRAVCSVVLNDANYLKASSLDRGEFLGEIGYFANGRIGGWCFWSGMPEKRVQLNIFGPSGSSLGSAATRLKRTELVDRGLHPTGDVGFRVDLSSSSHTLDKLKFVVDGFEVNMRPSAKLRKRIRRNTES